MMSRTAAPRPYRTPRPRFDRRTALGLAALLGVGAPTLAGCSQLSGLPGSGGGGPSELLGRVDPAANGDLPFLVLWTTRPAGIAEVLEVDPQAASTAEDTASSRLSMLTVPEDLGGVRTPEGASTLAPEVLFAPSEAICLPGQLEAGATVWVGAAAVLDQLEEVLADQFARDGDVLRIDPDGPWIDQALVRTVAAVGDDLVFTGVEQPDAFLDTGESLIDPFEDLPELLAAVDISDPHAVYVAQFPNGFDISTEDGADGRALGWVYATELTSPTEHVTRGAIRVAGDAGVLAEMLRNGAEGSPPELLGVAEAEPDGDLVIVTFAAAEDAPPGADPVAAFFHQTWNINGMNLPLKRS